MVKAGEKSGIEVFQKPPDINSCKNKLKQNFFGNMPSSLGAMKVVVCTHGQFVPIIIGD